MIASGQLGPDENVWCETMSNWATVAEVPELAAYAMPAALPQIQTNNLPPFGAANSSRAVGFAAGPDYQSFVGKKTGAGVVALLLGNLGIHKFMLGLKTGGLTMLILFCLVVPIPVLAVISLIEGVIYLTKSDEQFYKDYAIDKKQWF